VTGPDPGAPCGRCSLLVRYAQTIDGWRWVALEIPLPDPRRYRCPDEQLHTS